MIADHQLTPLLAYVEQRWQGADAGKTLLVAFQGERSLLAIAAGLRGEADHPNFITLAGYLLRRERADGYWLVMPGEQAGQALARLEVNRNGISEQACCPLRIDEQGARCQPPVVSADQSPLLTGLLRQEAAIPGLMRRQLDRLAGVIAVPLPVPSARPQAGLG